jgi:hypothetical protein
MRLGDSRERSRYNPFRRGWSIRLGGVRLRSIPWYWDVMRERLAASFARRRPVAPPPVHHDHYCQECDRRWVHEGHTCPEPWAARCPDRSHPTVAARQESPGRWLIVVRQDRVDLCQRLGESFEAEQRVTVLLDRRQSERRAPRSRKAPGAPERRRSKDRRTPQTGEDRATWATVGFRVQHIGSHSPQ